MADLAALLKEALKEALAPVLARFDRIDARMDKIISCMDKIIARMDRTIVRMDEMEAARANGDARRHNILRAAGAPKLRLPFSHDGKPNVQQPTRKLDLAVLGDRLPGDGGAANWSCGKKRRFLAAFAAPAEAGAGGEDADEDEGSAHARSARARVVRLMGWSFERVCSAAFAMH